jgi:hypothetical protein
MIHRKKKTMIRNAKGNLFEKRPDACPSCKKSLRLENIVLKETEIPQFNVDPADPVLYAVMEIWNTKKDTRAAWSCGLCAHRWTDGAEEC